MTLGVDVRLTFNWHCHCHWRIQNSFDFLKSILLLFTPYKRNPFFNGLWKIFVPGFSIRKIIMLFMQGFHQKELECQSFIGVKVGRSICVVSNVVYKWGSYVEGILISIGNRLGLGGCDIRRLKLGNGFHHHHLLPSYHRCIVASSSFNTFIMYWS